MDEVPKYTLMDAFNISDFEANGYKETAVADKSLNAYYAGQAATKPARPTVQPRPVLGDFSYTESGIVVCCTVGSRNVYVRNYVLHQLVRRIAVDSSILAFDLNTSKSRVAIALENGRLRVLDYTDEAQSAELACDSYHAFQAVQFCSHNMLATIAGPEVTTYNLTNQQ